MNRRQSRSSRLHVHVSQKWHCIWELWLCQATVSSALSSDEVSFYNSLLLELAKTSVLSFFFSPTLRRYCHLLVTLKKPASVPYIQSFASLSSRFGEWLTTSRILAWEIPWTEEPGGLHSMGLQKVGHDWKTFSKISLTARYGPKRTVSTKFSVCLLSRGGAQFSPPLVCGVSLMTVFQLRE